MIALLVLATVLATATASAPPLLLVQLGTNIGAATGARLLSHLQNTSVPVKPFPASAPLPPLPVGSTALVLGNGSWAAELAIADSDVGPVLGDEGFVVRAARATGGGCLAGANGVTVRDVIGDVNRGAQYGAYRLLERVGLAWMHPLRTVVPSEPVLSGLCSGAVGRVNETVREAYWPNRMWHFHTEHPLELTDVLQGFDVRNNANETTEEWASMLGEVDAFFEWLVANRQNRVEWNLLLDGEWAEFGTSMLRQGRLREIVQRGHAQGLQVGTSMSIASAQQHQWHAVTSATAPLATQLKQIRSSVDWVLGGADFDFISSALGTSEFTHPNCTLMLLWMNYTADYIVQTYPGKTMDVRSHISTGQFCPDFPDPVTGDPINFNHLPFFAKADVGVDVHTVQWYNMTEPTANSYGNLDFRDQLAFIQEIFKSPVENGRNRTVRYFGETAYWVNLDIDVPLFLPVYAFGRVSDMKTLAGLASAAPIAGTANFDSGWEWGYWVQCVITAKAAYAPVSLTLHEMLEQWIGTTFGGPTVAGQVADLLDDTIAAERQLLTYGLLETPLPPDDQSAVLKRNGAAYIEGWSTWSELGSIAGNGTLIQPRRMTLLDVRLVPERADFFRRELAPLFAAMVGNFTALTVRYRDLVTASGVRPEAAPLLVELADAMHITALRTVQIEQLYWAAYATQQHNTTGVAAHISSARAALETATLVMQNRSSHYRVPVQRIASWRWSPTAYSFGYLWPVQSMYFWWRDLGRMLSNCARVQSPCYLNKVNPASDSLGGTIGDVLADVLTWLYTELEGSVPSLDEVADCVSFPPDGFTFPANVTQCTT